MPATPSRHETLTHGTRVYVSETHKFGADALLLAEFCGAKRNERVCDFGTGCGVIPLRLHDRGHRGLCFAIDLAPEAVALLEASVAENSAAHITPLCADLRVLHPRSILPEPAPLFDLVTCNPPYFTGGFRSPTAAKAAARHEETCTVTDVCTAAARMLSDGGRLCVCQRPERLADVLCAMRAVRIEPKRMQFVTAQPQKEPWLFLVEGQKSRAPGMRMLPLLVTENPDGTRPSPAMRAIYES